ncbi:tyrosine-type recombinase/integrase [Mycolicibacter sp. MYC123]|uniref:Tyrosine-type recombinase/integrase n=1 Tax=[Mycobacterium] zoologicum TaxID=2872311 RepID=A0ABU5YHW9_9MYCO|nr:tyrosine-type recombinase/integrase [Mycolicibacter sp. MYC123]MEB3049044.1 tyrosine-type recombinase/integrase [Mycolicibacter sp. MYC123]
MSGPNKAVYEDTAVIASAAARPLSLSTVDAFMKLSPLQRFEELVAGPHFPECLRAEPIIFDGHDQIYGYLCDIPDCELVASGKAFCETHRRERVAAGKNGISEPDWRKQASPHHSPEHIDTSGAGKVSLAGLPPLAAAEIRYALYANATSPRPTKWDPRCLRALIEGLGEKCVASIMEIDTTKRPPGRGKKGTLKRWPKYSDACEIMIAVMQGHCAPVHVTRTESRQLGYVDPLHWGFRLKDRRRPFDLRAITQGWLRTLTWDLIAAIFDSPDRPRTASSLEQLRRCSVTLSAYLEGSVPDGGADASRLTEDVGRSFVADLTRRARNGEPQLGLYLPDGQPSIATDLSKSLTFNGLRRLMRYALESGIADVIGLRREFMLVFPEGRTQYSKRPRPLSDEVFKHLISPTNMKLLAAKDINDLGIEDIWFIQIRVGRRIGEVVNLRYDCVSEHLDRKYAWFDMTKVNQLDYGVLIPDDVFRVIRERQKKTAEKYRLKHGAAPTGKTAQNIALFPSATRNSDFVNAIAIATFQARFKQWLEEIELPGHVSHQARHTLATRLVDAGAPMVVVKQILGHVSERMSEHYTLISSSKIEPYLQQVWVKGSGSSAPGELVRTPDSSTPSAIQSKMIDIAALPTEGGLCTFKPVVGGAECPRGRRCTDCEDFVLTGADYAYWKRQEERWATYAENAPDHSSRAYVYGLFQSSSLAIAGLERALSTLGLLEQAKNLDLRNPYQDFFDPIWNHGWRSSDLIDLTERSTTIDHDAEGATTEKEGEGAA